MSDVQGIYRQSQPTPSPFPPYPYFELRARDAVYLLVPRSVSTAGINRFAMFGDGNGMPQDFIGKLRFEHLLDDLKNGYSTFGSGTVEIGTIRNFYMSWRHVASMEQTPALIDRLKRDIEQGSLVVFRFQSSPHWAIMRQTPGEPVPAASGPVSTWDGRQKVIAMFKAIPSFLQGAAKAEFEAFLTPENLAIMAAFLGGIAVMQAVPGADAAVDALIAGIAWWQFGWAGVVAGKDFVDAVIKAGRATSNDEIMLAAKLAAAALVSLGLTLLLKKITKNVHEVPWKEDEAQLASEPTPKSNPQFTTHDTPWGISKSERQLDPLVGNGKSFAGHGGIFANEDGTLPTTVVPRGTSVTVFTGSDQSLYDDAGQLIESGDTEAGMNIQNDIEPMSTSGAMTYLS